MLYSLRVARREAKCLRAARFFMKYTRILVLLSVAVALVVSACGGGSKGGVPNGDIATVKGEAITLAEFNDVLDQARRSYKAQKRTFPKAGTSDYQALVQSAVQFLVKRTEYEQKAKELGVKVTDADVAKRLKQIKKQYFQGSEKKYRAALKKQGLTDQEVKDSIRSNLIQEGLAKKVTAGIKVSETEVKAYYDQHPQQYSTPESRLVAHILVTKKALADTIYKQLCGTASPCLNSKADFAAAAKKYSIDTGTKTQGGKYNAVRGASVPEFDAVAFALKTGEISKPVHSRYGWHIIKALQNTKPRKTTPYAQVKEAIRQQLLSQKKNDALKKFTDDLDKEYADQVKYAPGYEPPATSTTGTTTASTTG
jgi:foldase protein PrsA